MSENLILIKSADQLYQVEEYLTDKEYVAFDTETTGVKKDSKIIGFSVCADKDTAYYVVLSYWDKEKQTLVDLDTTPHAARILSLLKGKALLAHNAIFDCSMIETNFGVSLIGSIHTDTMILAHLLDENRLNGLKELGVSIFGADAKKEQIEMKASVLANGGLMTKENYELYKGDADLIGLYGAKDTILTFNLFHHLIPILFEENLQDFFYIDESMPSLRGPMYDLNTTGLKVDLDAFVALKRQLEIDCLEAKAFIYKEIDAYVKDKYPGTSKVKTFNIGATQQLSWLLFSHLKLDFGTLTDAGRDVCRGLGIDLPYTSAARRRFIATCEENLGKVYSRAHFDPKTKKMTKDKKVAAPWTDIACDKVTLTKLAPRYKWIARLLEYNKNKKLLNTYVEGIMERQQYGIIRPSFLQHGTTSGRKSSRNPNFQNLPRDEKRIKKCIISRPGKVFVGADYSQLEPRVFASLSGDERLLASFKSDDDFYSVIGMEVFEKYDCEPKKDGPNAFGTKYKALRNIAKVIALSSTYGTTAPKMAPAIGKSIEEAQEVIDNYFEKFPKVKEMMNRFHDIAKDTGRATSIFGRPRRIPKAAEIRKIYGNSKHEKLPYEARNLLNLAVNHPIQGTGASVITRAAIAFCNKRDELAKNNPLWAQVKLVMEVHDELIAEGPEAIKHEIVALLKDCMENTVVLPGVSLVAEPVIANNLGDLK